MSLTQPQVFTGSSIENSIRSSLALGVQFAGLGTLPGTLNRERATDDLILSIEIFDVEGKPLYSTDRLRAARSVPAAWLEAARQAQSALDAFLHRCLPAQSTSYSLAHNAPGWRLSWSAGESA